MIATFLPIWWLGSGWTHWWSLSIPPDLLATLRHENMKPVLFDSHLIKLSWEVTEYRHKWSCKAWKCTQKDLESCGKPLLVFCMHAVMCHAPCWQLFQLLGFRLQHLQLSVIVFLCPFGTREVSSYSIVWLWWNATAVHLCCCHQICLLLIHSEYAVCRLSLPLQLITRVSL